MKIPYTGYAILSLIGIMVLGCSATHNASLRDRNSIVASNSPSVLLSDVNSNTRQHERQSLVPANGGLMTLSEVDTFATEKNREDIFAGSGTIDPEKTETETAGETEDNGMTADAGAEILDSALEYCEAAQELWSSGNPEKALESLDEAYQLVLKIDPEKTPELAQQKEDMRFMISKRILEIYTSRFSTVNGTHKEIPLTMNGHVEREIKSFQGYERDFFMEGYRRAGKYKEKIMESLKAEGMPEELAWLPFIESWYKVTALSPARALGIWQFIPSTGYRFGLKRDTWIDERMDPEKSTVAAIAYLKELHRMFGDWTTVLAAYNCGEGNVLRVIRQQKINYLDNFWDLYERLPRETARYVPRFLATLHIMKDPAKYGFDFAEPYPVQEYERITIQKQMQLKAVADSLGISAEELTGLNPELRRQMTPPVQYSLKIPRGSGDVLLAKLETIPACTVNPNDYVDYVYHTVKKGETLTRIAAKYRTNVNAIVKANKISRSRNLRIGQKLKIPVRNGKSNDMLSSAGGSGDQGTYRARKGETLKTIAKKFNTDTSRLKKINHLTSSLLYEGQLLKVSD